VVGRLDDGPLPSRSFCGGADKKSTDARVQIEEGAGALKRLVFFSSSLGRHLLIPLDFPETQGT
jgi:hypothetical protein